MSPREVFSISIWPIIRLNSYALLAISLFCVLFVYVDGGFQAGLTELEIIIISYFGGIGFLILLAASYLSYLSGPLVSVDSTGLHIRTAWLRDQAFPEKREFFMAWEAMVDVSADRFLTMRYARIRDNQGKTALYLPLFVRHREKLYEAIRRNARDSHPLLRFSASHLL